MLKDKEDDSQVQKIFNGIRPKGSLQERAVVQLELEAREDNWSPMPREDHADQAGQGLCMIGKSPLLLTNSCVFL